MHVFLHKSILIQNRYLKRYILSPQREHQEKQLLQQQQSDDPESDFDWKEFTTVDCIGDVDGDDKNDEDATDDQANANAISDEVPITNSGDIYVGSEFVKDVQVKYCEICQRYLPREDGEAALRKHCEKRSHLNHYLEHKEIERLRQSAVKIHQQEEKKRQIEKRKQADQQTKDAANASASNVSESVAGDSAADKSANSIASGAETGLEDDEEVMDSKIWADVDKDLGELLQAVSSENANDDEDEEDSTTTTER